jgi:xylan 1,4-beta-xylosidase
MMPGQGKLIGEPVNIFAGSPITGWSRARISSSAMAGTISPSPRAAPATITRSPWRGRATLTGPYELHPDTFLMTSKDAPDAPLQRAGHGQMSKPRTVRSTTPICARGHCPGSAVRRSGAKPAIQKCVWGEDGWLRLAQGGLVPDVDGAVGTRSRKPQTGGGRPSAHSPAIKLPDEFQWLRTPIRSGSFT